jgi:hemerythrin-like domain-containing protein
MKRDASLLELSRDHHHGLLLGWKVRQGLKAKVDVKVIAEYIQYFANEALIDHFKEEEEILLKYLPADDTFKERTLREHGDILCRVQLLDEPANINPESLLGIAGLLDLHIRFEEREFFPYLEQKLSADELNEVGLAIKEIHTPFNDSFSNEFWKVSAN